MCNRKCNIIEVRHKPMVDLSDTTLHTLVFSRINLREHLIERIEAELPATKERDEIVLFVRNSKRGIIKGYL